MSSIKHEAQSARYQEDRVSYATRVGTVLRMKCSAMQQSNVFT